MGERTPLNGMCVFHDDDDDDGGGGGGGGGGGLVGC